MTQPINCRCGGEAAVEANIEDDYVAVSCRNCGLRLVRDSVDYAKAEWNRIMAEPRKVTVNEIIDELIKHGLQIPMTQGALARLAIAIHELVYGTEEKE